MFLCIPHQSLMTRQAGKGTTPHLKNAASASRHDSQETARLDEDSERSSVVNYNLDTICNMQPHITLPS